MHFIIVIRKVILTYQIPLAKPFNIEAPPFVVVKMELVTEVGLYY